MGAYRLTRCLFYITRAFVPLDLILPDQPNRRIRTRTYGGVGGALSDERPYPDGFNRNGAATRMINNVTAIKTIKNSFLKPDRISISVNI